MYLNQQKRLVTLNELSEKLDISKNNLIKVSNQLANSILSKQLEAAWEVSRSRRKQEK